MTNQQLAKMTHFSTTILSNLPVAADFFELRFAWPVSLPSPLPGQFVTIRVSLSTVPLLRRPFAISSYERESGSAAIIYQKRGTATELLTAKAPGDPLDLIGPLGSSFTLPPTGARCIILAGGIGLGPMLFLGRSLRPPVKFIFGCRTRAHLPQESAFTPLTPIICTDDGSSGFKGTAIDYLRTLSLDGNEPAALFGCGPTPMLKALHDFSLERGWPCQVSIEQVMACGVGACMGCVVPVVGPPGYARVCTEGPVFASKDLLWT
jgi:dihydroorotate dehydrogenase electron transfer subunit